jgi:hypothetical protein
VRRFVLLVAFAGLGGLAPSALAQAPPTTATPTTLAAAPPTTAAAPPTTEAPRGPYPVTESTIVVDPDSGLVDGQTVEIIGDGYFLGEYDVYFCGDSVGDLDSCVVVGRAFSGRGYALVGEATLPIRFTGASGATVDCLVQACRVYITNGYQLPGDTAVVSFRGVIAARPGFTG